MTFEAWCRKHRYHLFYTRETSETVHVTHRYRNGKLALGASKLVGDWHCRIDSLTIGRSLRAEHKINTGLTGGPKRGTSSGPCPIGYGRSRAAAKRDLLAKIEDATLYIYGCEGRTDNCVVPRGLI